MTFNPSVIGFTSKISWWVIIISILLATNSLFLLIFEAVFRHREAPCRLFFWHILRWSVPLPRFQKEKRVRVTAEVNQLVQSATVGESSNSVSLKDVTTLMSSDMQFVGTCRFPQDPVEWRKMCMWTNVSKSKKRMSMAMKASQWLHWQNNKRLKECAAGSTT